MLAPHLRTRFKKSVKQKVLYFAAFLVAALFVLALIPEERAEILTDHDGWTSSGQPGNEVPLAGFPLQFRHVRESAVDTPGGVVFRAWTPETGVAHLEVISAAFQPARYMSIAITGSTRTSQGLVSADIQCEVNNRTVDVFRGSVNVNVAESIVAVPDGWCPGSARLRFVSKENTVNGGMGTVYKISYLSYLKSTYLGLLPYYIIAVIVVCLVMVSGASVAIRHKWRIEPLPMAFMTLGTVALATFYISSAGAQFKAGWLGSVLMAALIVYALATSGQHSRQQAVAALRPYALGWVIASFAYFTLLSLASNGLGHWEPNYRFWPATWSSDNELQWLIAVAIRHGRELSDLFGGGWLPTDRPPLMAGVYLLMVDLFELMQIGNDGDYLTGKAFNAAAVVLNSMWVPVSLWLLACLPKRMPFNGQALIILFMACIPVVLFNTVYGWPKAFGAAYALVGFGIAWLVRQARDYEQQRSQVFQFFIVCALSVMAHASTALFLAPVGLLFLWWAGLAQRRNIIFGFVMAGSVLLTWIIYKKVALPSSEPVIKYALTGDFGFGNSQLTLWEMIRERYAGLGFGEWLNIKKIMFLQAFLPVDHEVTQIHMNADSGASSVDKLRAWDFMMLSKGNIFIPVFVGIVILTVVRAVLTGRRKELENDAHFLILVMVSLVAWLLLVLAFLVPVVNHHWPQAALFGLALGAAVPVYRRYPKFFKIAFVVQLGYTVVVWIYSPLSLTLRVDYSAAAVLLLFAAGCFLYFLSNRTAYDNDHH